MKGRRAGWMAFEQVPSSTGEQGKADAIFPYHITNKDLSEVEKRRLKERIKQRIVAVIRDVIRPPEGVQMRHEAIPDSPLTHTRDRASNCLRHTSEKGGVVTCDCFPITLRTGSQSRVTLCEQCKHTCHQCLAVMATIRVKKLECPEPREFLRSATQFTCPHCNAWIGTFMEINTV